MPVADMVGRLLLIVSEKENVAVVCPWFVLGLLMVVVYL
jgi:hypothetical protein